MNKNITFKHINRIAIPALFAGIAEPLLSMVDTAFVGHLPELAKESLGAVGLVGVFLSMLIWILGQTRSAISTIVSQYLGRDRLEMIQDLPAQAVYSVVLLSIIIIGITYPLAGMIFKLYNADATLLKLSVTYFHIRIFGLPFTLLTFAIFGSFRGLQNTYYPMVIALVGALINVVLDYFFIYGISGVLPAMHIRGAAFASLTAQIIMAFLSVYYLYTKTPFRLRLRLPFNQEMKPLARMVLHLFIRTIALNTALYFGSAYATKYGNDNIAAYTIAINIWFFYAFILDGYAGAGNIISGKLYGAKAFTLLKRLSKKLTLYGVITGSVLAGISFVFYRTIGSVFIANEIVLHKFYDIFWIVLLMQPINGVAFIFDGIFKGLGQMKYLRNTLLFATFLGFLPMLFWGDFKHWGLQGIWLAFTVWMLLRAGLLVRKFYRLYFIRKL